MSYELLLAMARGNVPMERIEIAGGRTGGRLKVPDGPVKRNARVDRSRKGSGYATKFQVQDQEEDEIDEFPEREPQRLGKMMAAVEDLTSHGTAWDNSTIIPEDALRVYNAYSFDHTDHQQLLISDYKDAILAQIAANSVVVLKGPTGCGKSTQVPQYILDDARSSQIYCNIVITQPRRIAATSVAKRVCQERGWNMGSLVGYQIALEKKASLDTRLLFCTAGVLLQQLIGNRTLSMYTHIIIDEVHERDSETDFLLIVIKKLLKMRGNRTKVILMSATIAADKFVEYFSKKKDDSIVKPPVIDMEDETSRRYPVQLYFLNSLGDLRVTADVSLDEPRIDSNMYKLVATLLKAFPAIDSHENKDTSFLGSVLIFLPGIHEIDTLYSILHQEDSLARESGNSSESWILCPLHSTMSFDEQMKVFMPPPTGQRKIILSTNIAESSITVPDVTYVIDFCLTKHQVQDKDTFYSSLQLTWESKSQAKQRAGRVGRTRPGRVYRLIPKAMYEELEEDCIPEILRCPLERLVLKAKKLDFGPPVAILGSAMDPPDLTNIERTILNLKEVGALTRMIHDEYDDEDGDMTFIGSVMESLPLDIQLSKLILVGHMFSVLRECVIMACCMSGKNIFVSPLKQKIEAFNNRVAWSEGTASDALTYLNVYMVWKSHVAQGKFARSGGESEQQYATRNYVNLKALKEVERMENEIIARLDRLGIRDSKIPMVHETPDLLPVLYKMAIAGAFYPNYFTHNPIDEKEAVKTLGGRDPYKTVYLTKFPPNQPGPLYRNSIKKLFERCGSNIKVQFDNSSKVYIEFGNSYGLGSRTGIVGTNETAHGGSEEAVPGRVMAAVYRAVKLRQLNVPMKVPMLTPKDAAKKAKAIFGDSLSSGVFCWQKNSNPQPLRTQIQLPGLSIRHIRISITHIVDPHNFYAMLIDGSIVNNKSVWIHDELNDRTKNALKKLEANAIVPELLCIAPFSAGPHDYPKYYRCRILQVDKYRAEVFYIDYGNVELIEKSLLMAYGPELVEKGVRDEPPLCINCRLAEIQPVAYKQARLGWCPEAIREFKRKFTDSIANAKIYSTVNDTMAIYLFPDADTRFTKKFKLSNEESFNHYLVGRNVAQFMEEPYLSKENHELREKAIENPHTNIPSFHSSADERQRFLDEVEFNSPTESETHLSMCLLGPKSPLEMSVGPLTRKCIGKEAGIEFNSVNSVLLDNNPMDTSSRLIVAGTVTQNMNSERLTLRNTTIMPSCRGIVGLMCLIFAPTAELRVDPTRSYVTGALCGLGCNEEGESYDQENDVEVAFDCKFEMSDIETINKIRFWMNEILCGSATCPEEQLVSRAAAHSAQTKVVQYLLTMFSKTRDPLCQTSYQNVYEWNQVPEEYLMKPTNTDHRPFVYPLIWGIQLRESSNEAKIESLTKHLLKLDMYAVGSETLRNTIACEVCQIYFESSQAIALHLKTAVHKTRVREMKERIGDVTADAADHY